MSKFVLWINVAVLVILAGCKGAEKEKVMGPEQTVEAFCRAVTAGEWAEAEALCDTLSMKEYLDSYKEAWETLHKEDSCAMAIAKGILAGTVMSVDDIRKEDDRRIISYTLTADGNRKARKAVVRKEEGAWRVERISDVL